MHSPSCWQPRRLNSSFSASLAWPATGRSKSRRTTPAACSISPAAPTCRCTAAARRPLAYGDARVNLVHREDGLGGVPLPRTRAPAAPHAIDFLEQALSGERGAGDAGCHRAAHQPRARRDPAAGSSAPGAPGAADGRRRVLPGQRHAERGVQLLRRRTRGAHGAERRRQLERVRAGRDTADQPDAPVDSIARRSRQPMRAGRERDAAGLCPAGAAAARRVPRSHGCWRRPCSRSSPASWPWTRRPGLTEGYLWARRLPTTGPAGTSPAGVCTRIDAQGLLALVLERLASLP